MDGRAREQFVKDDRIMIIGAGYSGRAFAKQIRGNGNWIGGTTRSQQKAERLREIGIEPHIFDGSRISPDLAQALKAATHLVVSIAPDEDGDPFLRSIGGDLGKAMPALCWIGYLSTVGVYGNHDGAWVNEETPPKPVSPRSVQRVAAEKAWQDAAGRYGLPLATLRLSGIYGPGRNALVNLERGKARRLIKPGQVFNRIHVADIAAALEFLGERKAAGIFNITDNEPSPPQDVVAFAARLMGVAPPPEIPFDKADMSPMAMSFYGENKRVSNSLITGMGFYFNNPNYRIALTRMWEAGDWKEQFRHTS
jgi:nucleoside-diphosphate-sugar epimerase